jgi:hypothetical protein
MSNRAVETYDEDWVLSRRHIEEHALPEGRLYVCYYPEGVVVVEVRDGSTRYTTVHNRRFFQLEERVARASRGIKVMAGRFLRTAIGDGEGGTM